MHDFELEDRQTRTEVADYLHKLANGLERDNKLTFVVGDESTTIHPPEDVHFRMETNRDSSWLGGDDGQSVVIELGWAPDAVEASDELTIIDQPDEETVRTSSRSETASQTEQTTRQHTGSDRT